jgi:hypothetical protein
MMFQEVQTPAVHTEETKIIFIMGSIQKPAVYVVDPYHDAAFAKLKEYFSIDLIFPSNDGKKSQTCFLGHVHAPS